MADAPDLSTRPAADPAAAAPVAAPEPVVDAGAPAAADAAPAAEAPVSEPTLLEQAKTEAAPAAEDAGAAGDKPADEPAAAPTPDGEKPAESAAKPEDKPADAAGGKPAAEAAPAAEPAAPEPIEYQYTLPETLTLPEEMKAEAHAAFDQFRANPANPQPLIDFHEKAMRQHAERMRQEQWDVFNTTRKEWRTAVLADEVIGGAGHETAMKAIAAVRDRFASNHKPGTKEYDADMQGFDGMLRATGVGDHPEFLKFLHRVGEVWNEPRLPSAQPNPSPTNGRKPGSRADVLYNNSPSMKRN